MLYFFILFIFFFNFVLCLDYGNLHLLTYNSKNLCKKTLLIDNEIKQYKYRESVSYNTNGLWAFIDNNNKKYNIAIESKCKVYTDYLIYENYFLKTPNSLLTDCNNCCKDYVNFELLYEAEINFYGRSQNIKDRIIYKNSTYSLNTVHHLYLIPGFYTISLLHCNSHPSRHDGYKEIRWLGIWWKYNFHQEIISDEYILGETVDYNSSYGDINTLDYLIKYRIA